MARAVFSHLGAASGRVRVGPGFGLDNAVISVGQGRVLILTLDPVSVIPGLGTKLSAWLSVRLIASDYTASGCDPEFATFGFNFPPEMPASDREGYLRSVGEECRRLGVSIVGGNTGSYPGAAFTVVGTGSMLGFAEKGRYVTPAMARVGDEVFVTKHAAIEATGSLANSFPALEESVGPRAFARAKRTIHSCSTVEDARVASRVGLGKEGVTSMHDATEGGVLGGLHEMSVASRKSFEIDPSRIPVPEEVAETCGAFGLDPLRTMGEGALLLTCNPHRSDELRRKMTRAEIVMSEIGRVKGGEGLWLTGGGSRRRRFAPAPDAYWAAYARASRKHA